MNIEIIDKYLISRGYQYTIWRTDGEWDIAVCRPEWITNDIYQARPLPEGKGETFEEAYKNLLDKIGEK